MTAPVPIPDSHRDLLLAPGVGVLGTLGPGGLPQSSAIWYVLDGDEVRTSLTGSRQKFKNLRRHPKTTLLVLDPTNPYRYIEVRAEVALEPDPDLAFLARVLAHYGTDLDSFPGPKEDRWIVTFTPVHVITYG
jgi:PPOX class probable F420-dependent enzyme